MTNDTRKRGLWRLNIALPERIEAALFRPRLDKLTFERTPECECVENNTQGSCDGCEQRGKEYPEAWIA
jgi:hypothetical protein